MSFPQSTKVKLFTIKKTTMVIIFFLSLLLGLSTKIHAQTGGSPKKFVSGGSDASLGVARLIELKEKDVQDGNIISSSETGAVLSNIPYDGHVLGVVARDAAIVINSSGVTEGFPVISNGQVYILVSSKDGAIKKGNLLTTSTIPGVAVKAIKSGYVLGTALEDYDDPDPQKTDKIVVELDLHYFNSKPTFPGSLSDIFKIALLPTREGPSPIFKYIIAAIVVLGSFTFGFMTFGRTAAKGVEALGRNPAAKGVIYLGIIFNVSLVSVIILAGLAVAILILRL
jgi:F0F1-type ATP synthase membrane subunit c/vacuolar-type H+-ATPase subunit K